MIWALTPIFASGAVWACSMKIEDRMSLMVSSSASTAALPGSKSAAQRDHWHLSRLVSAAMLDLTDARREMIAMMYLYGGHMTFWQAFLSWTGLILLWVLLAGVTYLLYIKRMPARPDHWQELQDTLDGRLASGEIDQDEYRRMHDPIGQRH